MLFFLSIRSFYLDKFVLFGQGGFILAKGCCIFLQNGSIWANWFHLGKLVLLWQGSGISAKWVVFNQMVFFFHEMVVFCFSTKWVIIPKMCCVWLNDFILPKRVGVGKTLLYFGKLVVLGVKWVVFVQYMRCICPNHLYLAKWVVIAIQTLADAGALCV